MMIDGPLLNLPGVDARSKVATRRIKSFHQRFGTAHLLFAYHAAFPLALTPDLLYLLWANFPRDIHHTLLNIPWEAVADLLLSNLCDEVGYELYEMDVAVRNALLRQLEDDPRFGPQRIKELSYFLLDYIRQQLNSHDPDVSDFARMQRWTALAYIQPDKAARELAMSLATLVLDPAKSGQLHKTEFLRMASLTETLAEPLAEFKPLLNYTYGLARFVRGDLEGAADQLQQIVDPGSLEIQIAGINLTIPEGVWGGAKSQSGQEQTVEPLVKLVVGGPVQARSGTYLVRPADDELFRACVESEFAYVLTCRQMGMSSLMFATAERLSQSGIRTALIDLNSIGHNVEADSWYFSLIDEIAHKLKLEVDIQTWWVSRSRLSTPITRFLQFLREVVLAEISEPIVIFIDEIDMTLDLDFTDDFFVAIRLIHNDRARSPDFHRLSFVLLGVATPDELIKDYTRTPFNIGHAIALRDFTKTECEPFNIALEAKYPQQGRYYFDQIYGWTSGHPYLTQKLCVALLETNELEAERENSSLVDWLVRKLFLAPEAQREDNIQFVQTRITSDPSAQEMLRIYKRILEENSVADDERSPAISRLKLYGLVLTRTGRLEVRNKIYTLAFNLAWTDEVLKSGSVKLGLPTRYKILQEIGQGGFSTVYLAQLENAGETQTVALKVLQSAGINDTQIMRFKQEARVVAKLNHPNIIRIFEISIDEKPSFIAMEYISGGALRDRLKSGPLSRHEAMDIIRQIGAALAYAHAQGIIHRDVNPNNILLDTHQDPLRPVLTDFGLVKLLLRDEHTQETSTSIIGTFDYMAPEQWRQETPTPATDLYALAITFFEMLSGKHPFEAVSFFQLMDQHTNEPLPLLSSIAPEVGSFFDEVLRRAAAKNPADRFVSVADFIDALEAANKQAEHVEQTERKMRAAAVIEAVQSYIQKGRYDPGRALSMIEAALEECPEYFEALALRGRIWLQQGQFERALEDYYRAYQQNQDISSKIGLDYLRLLTQIAESLWQREEFQEAVKYYETIQQILSGHEEETEAIQEIWQKARSCLVEYYYQEGDKGLPKK